MDVQQRIKSWKKARRDETVAFKKRLTLLDAATAALEQLPTALSYVGMTPQGQILLSAFLSDDTEVKALIREIRDVLHVRESTKELNSSNGTLIYRTENAAIATTVYGGAVPENCSLIPEAHSYITYTMKCEEK